MGLGWPPWLQAPALSRLLHTLGEGTGKWQLCLPLEMQAFINLRLLYYKWESHVCRHRNCWRSFFTIKIQRQACHCTQQSRFENFITKLHKRFQFKLTDTLGLKCCIKKNIYKNKNTVHFGAIKYFILKEITLKRRNLHVGCLQLFEFALSTLRMLPFSEHNSCSVRFLFLSRLSIFDQRWRLSQLGG